MGYLEGEFDEATTKKVVLRSVFGVGIGRCQGRGAIPYDKSNGLYVPTASAAAAAAAAGSAGAEAGTPSYYTPGAYGQGQGGFQQGQYYQQGQYWQNAQVLMQQAPPAGAASSQPGAYGAGKMTL